MYLRRLGFLWFDAVAPKGVIFQVHLDDLEIYEKEYLDEFVHNVDDKEIQNMLEESHLDQNSRLIAEAIFNGTYTDEMHKEIFKASAINELKKYGIDLTKWATKKKEEELGI